MREAEQHRGGPVATAGPEQLSEAGLAAWRSLVRASGRLVAELDRELRDEDGLTLGEYDVLVALAATDGCAMRMCELADAVVLSPSGLSRRVARLERAGLVGRRRAEADARAVETELTPAGRTLLGRARVRHRSSVKERFADHFDERELEALRELLERVAEPGAGDERPAS